jgi:hypothetical protein
MRQSYEMRRNLIVARLNGMGLHCFNPGGAFYVFPDIRSTGLTSKEFAIGLLEQKSVAVVPRQCLWRSRRGLCALLLRHRARPHRQSHGPHGGVRERSAEVAHEAARQRPGVRWQNPKGVATPLSWLVYAELRGTAAMLAPSPRRCRLQRS